MCSVCLGFISRVCVIFSYFRVDVLFSRCQSVWRIEMNHASFPSVSLRCLATFPHFSFFRCFDISFLPPPFSFAVLSPSLSSSLHSSLLFIRFYSLLSPLYHFFYFSFPSPLLPIPPSLSSSLSFPPSFLLIRFSCSPFSLPLPSFKTLQFLFYIPPSISLCGGDRASGVFSGAIITIITITVTIAKLLGLCV